MSSRSMSDTKITTKQLAQLAIIAALMVAGKEALSFIPNVHPVMLLITITTIVYGWKALLPVICFDLVEIIIYGFGLWTIMYLYIWPLAVLLVMIFREEQSRLFWAIIAGGFGLIFGALCSIPYIFTSGINAAIAYWIAGIPYDLIHGVSNFVIIFFLLNPMCNLLKKLKEE